MSPERAAAHVARWVRLYTAGLPESVALRRREEMDADLSDHIAHDRSQGVLESRIAWNIARRMVRGAIADVSWREHELRSARVRSAESQTSTTTRARSARRVGAFVLAVLMVPFVGMASSEDVAWSAFDFVLAGVLLTIIGTCVEVAVRRRGSVLLGVAVVVLGVAAAAVGEIDDAPGLVLLGGLLITGGASVAHRRVRHPR